MGRREDGRHCKERSDEAIVTPCCLCEPAEGRRDNPQWPCFYYTPNVRTRVISPRSRSCPLRGNPEIRVNYIQKPALNIVQDLFTKEEHEGIGGRN